MTEIWAKEIVIKTDGGNTYHLYKAKPVLKKVQGEIPLTYWVEDCFDEGERQEILDALDCFSFKDALVITSVRENLK